MKNKLLDMKTLKTLFLAVIIFYSKNINSQNTNFCYGSITVSLNDGGTAIMTRKGTSGNIVSKVIGTYDLYGKGNSTETLQIRFKGIIYRYDLIRNGYGSPSVLIDNQGRKYDICSSSSISYGGGLTMPKIVVAALPTVAQKKEYYLEKTKENVYVVKNKNTKNTMFYVVPDDLFYANKAESRLGFDKAKSLVESLNKDNLFEWRLPTFSELEIIYNLKSKFEKRPSMEMYWTDTTSDNNPKTSFKCVNFTDGSIVDGLKYTSGRVGYGKSSYGYVFAVRDFISKDEKVSFKIPNNNDVYVPKEYYTKIFDGGDSFRSDEEVKVNKPEFDGDWKNFIESNKLKDSEIPWEDIPKGNYSLIVDFTVSREGEISDIKSNFMEKQYYIFRDVKTEILNHPFIIKNSQILKESGDGRSYYLNPNEIDHPAFKAIKNEAARLISMGKWKPAYLNYYNANKKIPINFKLTADYFFEFYNN